MWCVEAVWRFIEVCQGKCCWSYLDLITVLKAHAPPKMDFTVSLLEVNLRNEMSALQSGCLRLPVLKGSNDGLTIPQQFFRLLGLAFFTNMELIPLWFVRLILKSSDYFKCKKNVFLGNWNGHVKFYRLLCILQCLLPVVYHWTHACVYMGGCLLMSAQGFRTVANSEAYPPRGETLSASLRQQKRFVKRWKISKHQTQGLL